MPERGEVVQVHCVVAPVTNRFEGVTLWEKGDRAEVTWSGFWEGMLERGAIGLGEPPSDVWALPEDPKAEEPKPEGGLPVVRRKGKGTS